MTRVQAKERGIEAFVKPILGSARNLPKGDLPTVHDDPKREVVLVASRRDVEGHAKLRAYLGDAVPRIANVRSTPIAVTYVGVPRFVANPNGLVVTNALFTATPRQSMTPKEVLALVKQLNAAMSRLPKARFAERRSPRAIEAIDL
jgi:hypothetical protein